MRSNGHFRGLYEAALARQRADWLYGINLTRLYTVLGRAGGSDGVLSVGRVQTPLLGLIVRRDREIEAFQPRAYFVVHASLQAGAPAFRATWQPPSKRPAKGETVDWTDRFVSRAQATQIRAAVKGCTGTITSFASDEKREASPLPYALADLQIDAGKRLGLSSTATLGACQSLYETHRLLTYPRSDCRYLPTGQFDQATAVLAAVAANVSALAVAVGGADRARRSRAWDDGQITAHHALIPTMVVADTNALSEAERGVYELVARRYLAQFYPAFVYRETRVQLELAGERFRATGRQTVVEGWCPLLAFARPAEGDERDPGAEEETAQPLPVLREGEAVTCKDVTLTERQTTPPKRFTEAGLIEAMTGIARYVDDAKVKQLLRETDASAPPPPRRPSSRPCSNATSSRSVAARWCRPRSDGPSSRPYPRWRRSPT
jgi:DNA topoisomerase-3